MHLFVLLFLLDKYDKSKPNVTRGSEFLEMFISSHAYALVRSSGTQTSANVKPTLIEARLPRGTRLRQCSSITKPRVKQSKRRLMAETEAPNPSAGLKSLLTSHGKVPLKVTSLPFLVLCGSKLMTCFEGVALPTCLGIVCLGVLFPMRSNSRQN